MPESGIGGANLRFRVFRAFGSKRQGHASFPHIPKSALDTFNQGTIKAGRFEEKPRIGRAAQVARDIARLHALILMQILGIEGRRPIF
jgi:hypothetical protein